MLENAVEMGLLEKWAVGWRKSATLRCVWCVICMVMSSPSKRHGVKVPPFVLGNGYRRICF